MILRTDKKWWQMLQKMMEILWKQYRLHLEYQDVWHREQKKQEDGRQHGQRGCTAARKSPVTFVMVHHAIEYNYLRLIEWQRCSHWKVEWNYLCAKMFPLKSLPKQIHSCNSSPIPKSTKQAKHWQTFAKKGTWFNSATYTLINTERAVQWLSLLLSVDADHGHCTTGRLFALYVDSLAWWYHQPWSLGPPWFNWYQISSHQYPAPVNGAWAILSACRSAAFPDACCSVCLHMAKGTKGDQRRVIKTVL